ncbi:Cytochrome P450 94A2 [Linum perenne]
MLQLIITFFLPLLLLLLIFSLSRPATKNPCPDSYPLIGNIIAFLRNYHRFHDWITQMLSTTPSASLQVNSFLNISNGVGTSNPANIQHILHTNFDNYIKGTRFHNVLHEFLGDGIFNADGQIWTFQRKIASHEFSTKSLKLFISDVVLSEVSDHLLPFLDEKSEEGQVFDLQQVLHKFAFRSICRVAFGVDPESILPNLDFMKSFDDAVETCFARFTSPFPAYWKLKRFLNLGSEKHFKQSIRAINEFAFHDTTSTALTWFFWLIAGNPRCADLIHRELSAAAAAEEQGSESERCRFGYDKLKRLDYVHAALSESMRLFPPVPLNSKLAVDDDVWPDGTQVRKGWFADYSAYAVGRMEKVWGPDCMEFKPERWLEEGRYKPSDQFKYPVFHCGPRMCLGKEMAYIQMKAIVAAVMMEYEVLAIDGGASVEKMVNPPYTLSLLLKMRGGLPVRIKRRL